MKINIHSDQYTDGAAGAAQGAAPGTGVRGGANGSALPKAGSGVDVVAATPLGSNISDTLAAISSARAARVLQLSGVYTSGRYTVSVGAVAQSMVARASSGGGAI